MLGGIGLCPQRFQVLPGMQDQGHTAGVAQHRDPAQGGPRMSEGLCQEGRMLPGIALPLIICFLLIYALRTSQPRCFMAC